MRVTRAAVASTPRLAETLRGDRGKATRFYTRFSVTEAQLRRGVTTSDAQDADQNAVGF